MENNDKYQTAASRFGAAIIDAVVFIPFLFMQDWLFNQTSNTTVLVTWTIVFAFLPIFYSITAHYKYGQTIGKWVTGVKVVDISEVDRLRLKQCILRDIPALGIQTFGLVYFGYVTLKTSDPFYIINKYNRFSDQPYSWWMAIELFSMFTNQKRRAVHDFIAQTVVVKVLKVVN